MPPFYKRKHDKQDQSYRTEDKVATFRLCKTKVIEKFLGIFVYPLHHLNHARKTN
jgi:hypothetical protein